MGQKEEVSNSAQIAENGLLGDVGFIGKKFIDTWKDEIVTIVETTCEPGYFKFENENYSTYNYIGERFAHIANTLLCVVAGVKSKTI